ncbi:glycosyltransferase [Streptosporangium sp. NBC_01755]|uniref:glycosyltransferase n=1 Tax=unclassified Streptosporangium TaxID=2632669 RepID=UPI002DD94BF7|nr:MULTISPECIES: glycosyltransferase [unclassified Streptosporangium]WSA24016.1 glycosyltransferase [Streptosporangium sp. NBC_01810]WSC97912.1 glycosyltransferase [Streptosporangium sp. NBC_01755]
MTLRILVGLPSFNEAETIATVTRDIDAALSAAPFPVTALLVNADNSSTDRTAEQFLTTATQHPKRVLTTAHASGKGTNWQALFRLLDEGEFDIGVMVDTDLGGVPASWIHKLIIAASDSDFAFPLRPPTWNGGDLTYQLAYPMLAGVFGADLREPLCGDIALSRRGAKLVLDQNWTDSAHRFGVDALVASVALSSSWRMVPLQERRRNKLRSFSGGFGMGPKFAEVAISLQERCRLRLGHPPPQRFDAAPMATPAGDSRPVPAQDADISQLAAETSLRLAADLGTGATNHLPEALTDQLRERSSSGALPQGLPWPLWREVLLAWIRDQHREIPISLLETLFLSRVVGHHHEIKGRADWYGTVRDQARDLFDHCRSLWSS